MSDFIKKYKHGDAVFRVLNVDNINRIIDVLVKIKGDGCLIEKPVDAEGRNWRIIFDRRRSDTQQSGGDFPADDTKPMDYLIRFVGGVKRESQYGDLLAQTDFKITGASNQWIRDTMLPLGYCYLTFTTSGGDVTTAKATDNVSTGFSLKAQRKNAGRLYRLAHGNQYAAFIRKGDGNSIQIDFENYADAPAYILRQWNTDNNYTSIPKSVFENGGGDYAFMHYDTYLGENETAVTHPHEIKFAQMNKAFFQDFVFHVSEIAKEVIEDNLCQLVLYDFLETWRYHVATQLDNPDGVPYAGTPGANHGGWVRIDRIDGLADWDDFSQFLQDCQALHDRVFSSPFSTVEDGIAACATLKQLLESLKAQLDDYGDSLAEWQAELDNAATALPSITSAIDALESTATSQEARVENLKRIIGNS